MSDGQILIIWCGVVVAFIAAVRITTPGPKPPRPDYRKWWRRPPS